MTSGTAPRGVAGKDISNLFPFDASSSRPITREEAIKENAAIIARNLLRDSQRDDPNFQDVMEEHEPLLDLDELDSNGNLRFPRLLPPFNPGDSGNFGENSLPSSVSNILSEVLKMTPRSKKLVSTLLLNDTEKSVDPEFAIPAPEILFSTANERPVESRTSVEFRVHPHIITLAKSKHHIPLSMFTSASTDKLWKNSASLSMKKITTISGSKATILDLTQFPDEDDISISEFHEAYQNLLEFQGLYGDQEFHQRSSSHYKFLRTQPHFTLNFRAIKAFDKEQRQEASYDPRTFNEDRYLTRFESVKAEIFRSEQREDLERLRRGGLDRSESRYQPYPSSSKTASVRKDGKPFREGKIDTPGAGTCLICGRPGHKFHACTYITTENKSPVFAKWTDKKFTVKLTGASICINFNIYGPGNRCTKNHSSCHICSICGDPNHHATAGLCLGT